jgi:hypothetical protein
MTESLETENERIEAARYIRLEDPSASHVFRVFVAAVVAEHPTFD